MISCATWVVGIPGTSRRWSTRSLHEIKALFFSVEHTVLKAANLYRKSGCLRRN